MIVSVFGGNTSFADYPIFNQRYTADPSGLDANGRIDPLDLYYEEIFAWYDRQISCWGVRGS